MWGNTYKSSLEPLYILQKRAIRIIHNVSYLEHIDPLFVKSKIIKFYDIVEFLTAQFQYKAMNNLLPSHLLKMFHEREGGYDLRETLNFKIRRCQTSVKRFCITHTAVRLWKRLSVDLKQCPGINQFKNKYKQIIFTRYREEGA